MRPLTLVPNLDPLDSDEVVDWSDGLSMTARYFKVSFRKMIDLVSAVDAVDFHIIETWKANQGESWFLKCVEAQDRIDARESLVQIRIIFELGWELPMMNAPAISHKQLALDFHKKGFISDERLKRALDGKPSKDLVHVEKYVAEVRSKRSHPSNTLVPESEK